MLVISSLSVISEQIRAVENLYHDLKPSAEKVVHLAALFGPWPLHHQSLNCSNCRDCEFLARPIFSILLLIPIPSSLPTSQLLSGYAALLHCFPLPPARPAAQLPFLQFLDRDVSIVDVDAMMSIFFNSSTYRTSSVMTQYSLCRRGEASQGTRDEN